MARKQPTAPREGRLFEHQEQEHSRRLRRQRALFIPRYVEEIARNQQLTGAAQDSAYAIALRWADLETTGRLASHKETSIDTQFLDQLFGEGLGYTNKTTSPDAWQLEHKFTVPGVGTADGAFGDFPNAAAPRVVIELKDSRTDLDRDRSNGRTAVQQCWDYLNALPECPWGIVSNFSTIRLYHRTKGIYAYEEFTLQELRSRERFNEFYALFERGGLLQSRLRQPPRAAALLAKTENRQKEVGDELYKSYQSQRTRLIAHLMERHDKPLNSAIAAAQKLLDRVIFIAFCEDRGLMRSNALEDASKNLPAFTRATNPRWQNFLRLFEAMDKGTADNGEREIPAFNGGLFAHDPEVDELQLEDIPWTTGFSGFGSFDFSEEVNVEVLGHLFERSITELEKLRIGGLYALKAGIEDEPAIPEPRQARGKNKTGEGGEESSFSKMPKSAERKRFGIYYTPPAFTGLIVERTVDALVRERFAALARKHGVDPEAREDQDPKKLLGYWSACLEELKTITVCDPACGSGAFLIRAYEALDAHYKAVVHGLGGASSGGAGFQSAAASPGGAGFQPARLKEIEDSIPDLILGHNLFGVDLSREAVEITQLALWIRSARRGKTLADLSKNILHGNSLVADKSVDPHALDWHKAFPTVFPVPPITVRGDRCPPHADTDSTSKQAESVARGFSCVIGNPPWERVKVQDREFFSLTDPITAEAVNASDRKKRIAAMPEANPELHASYLAARDNAQKMLDYARGSRRYPLTGKGDVNLYMLFAELARSLVAPAGIVGLLVPSGIATDDTTKDFFTGLMDDKRLISLYDFENRNKIFEDVDGRFKFSALVFGGAARKTEKADFVFFARGVEDTAPHNKQRHIPLTAADMALFNPNTKTCPIFRTRRDSDLTRAVYKRVPILIDENRKSGGNPWGIKFLRMFDQTNDAEHFVERKVWERKKYKLEGNVFVSGKKRALPLYEAKMVQAFDHRAASVMVEDDNWVRQGQKTKTEHVHHLNPEFAVLPRWWVDEVVIDAVSESKKRDWLLAYKDVTSATNERTMIAAFLPWVAVVNSAPLMFVGEEVEPWRECCLLANLNVYAYDFIARQKVGSVHLNFFIVEQLPTLPPDTYADKCPWSKRETLEHWVSERVLKLSCTAEDMIPLAKACNFKGSRGDGVHIWKEQERQELRAELDAAYFILYGIERADVEYILSTFTNTGHLKEQERQSPDQKWQLGGAGHLILDAYDHLSGLST
ncbi:MAG: hypothetical protein JNK58_03150, partial [Phycisphaerae bacterium]|nr:hypothetical protein [Phycisphaerae bacterium]